MNFSIVFICWMSVAPMGDQQLSGSINMAPSKFECQQPWAWSPGAPREFIVTTDERTGKPFSFPLRCFPKIETASLKSCDPF